MGCLARDGFAPRDPDARAAGVGGRSTRFLPRDSPFWSPSADNLHMKSTSAILICLALQGCALFDTRTAEEKVAATQARREAKGRAQYEKDHKHDGKTEDDILMEFGAPTRIENAGSFLIYYYRTEKGYSGRGNTTDINGIAINNTKAKYHYEQTAFFFREGKVAKFQYESR